MPYHREGQATPAACPSYVKEARMSAINQLRQKCVRFQRRTYTPFRCRARVVAKSAHLRFRLAAKTALAPLLLLSPQSLRLCGDPRLGRCVLRTRWGAALPKPLAHPQERNTRFASVLFLRVRYRQCQIGTHVKNANLASLEFCRGERGA